MEWSVQKSAKFVTEQLVTIVLTPSMDQIRKVLHAIPMFVFIAEATLGIKRRLRMSHAAEHGKQHKSLNQKCVANAKHFNSEKA